MANAIDYASSIGLAGTLKPGCKLLATAPQSISSGSWSSLGWDSEDYDDNNFHSNSTNNSRITINGGLKRVEIRACVPFEADVLSAKCLRVRHFNSADSLIKYASFLCMPSVSGGNETILFGEMTTEVSDQDYFDVQVMHSSGLPLDANIDADYSFFELKTLV